MKLLLCFLLLLGTSPLHATDEPAAKSEPVSQSALETIDRLCSDCPDLVLVCIYDASRTENFITTRATVVSVVRGKSKIGDKIVFIKHVDSPPEFDKQKLLGNLLIIAYDSTKPDDDVQEGCLHSYRQQVLDYLKKKQTQRESPAPRKRK